MAARKVNDNGTPPSHPVPPTRAAGDDLEGGMREAQEDYELRDAQRAKREGLSESYTKAPWLTGGNE